MTTEAHRLLCHTVRNRFTKGVAEYYALYPSRLRKKDDAVAGLLLRILEDVMVALDKAFEKDQAE